MMEMNMSELAPTLAAVRAKRATSPTPNTVADKRVDAKAFKTSTPPPNLKATTGKRAKPTAVVEAPTQLTPATTMPTTKRGAAKLSDDPAKMAGQIAELLAELKLSMDTDDKKRIRRLLRARGHVGGLNAPKRVKTSATAV